MITFKPYDHYDLAIEKAVIGQILLEPLAMGRIYGLLEPEQFYNTSNREAMKHLRTMYDGNIPIDLLTATSYMVSQGMVEIDGIPTTAFLSATMDRVVRTDHLEWHCHILRQQWQKREIIRLKSETLDGDPMTDIEAINRRISEIIGGQVKKDWYTMEEMLFALMQHQSDMASGRKTYTTTGYKAIDRRNGGFYGGQMVVVGARPSVGKSAFMGQMSLSQAHSKKRVGIISLEMDNVQIAARLSSIETDISFSTIYRDIAQDEALHRQFYDKISHKAVKLPIFISDKTKVTVPEIRAKAIKLKATHGCDVLMVDYLQLVESSEGNRNYNREQEVAKMSRGLKLLAMELDIPVIVLCQLNRQSTSRNGESRYPVLSDLRESGAIEQDADIVLFLHRDYMSGIETDEQGRSTYNSADLLIAKWRNGEAPFRMELGFDPAKMKFYEKDTLSPIKITNDKNDEKDLPF